MGFTHLHVHTQYSILDGASSIPALMKKAKEDEMKAIAITDHGWQRIIQDIGIW
jgi:DNA polymerase-3 subunit alpha